MKTHQKGQKLKYVAPKVEAFQIEFEQSIAAGSGNVNTGGEGHGANGQSVMEQSYDAGWSNNKDFDL
ncbi:hypothetical protein ACLCDV_10245 [Sphingobacterium sp. Lzh-3]|jgi:hypothetical protein|uniref:hypothetical protein n=1 Tax=unclassified Sphingobacterium TaxID=2609468 RepID=UPI00295374FC|nr:hypothetical protein [Sphingobacterium sp. UGAL515B_05]WON94220.1 hypothetical protein OK025_23610 [Sphingobacterium sp. UGAL515B_05]